MATIPAYTFGALDSKNGGESEEKALNVDYGIQGFARPPSFDQFDTMKSNLKNDSLSVVQLVVELQIEKMRTAEALRARDAVVHKLAEAYDTLRQRTSVLDRLQATGYDRSTLTSPVIGPPSSEAEVTKLKEEISSLQDIIKALQDELKVTKESSLKAMGPPPRYEDGLLKASSKLAQSEIPEHMRTRPQSQPVNPEMPHRPGPRPTDSPLFSQSSPLLSSCSCHNSPSPNAMETKVDIPELEGPFYVPQSEDTAEMVKARCSVLASLPLPDEVPDDMLSPLTIPAPYTLSDFVTSMSAPLRTSLGSYRVFHGLNTVWCPDREEHGYFYSPVFKCSTNPRVNTAHRWNTVDVINRMNKPTECFFNKDGIWYYAGVYKAFRLADLTTKEWSELSNEATQSIVKETIAGRKNTSPQNIYEISQLYAAGALKVACIALQCVSFNNTMYKALLEQTSVFAQSKMKNPLGGGSNAGSPAPGAASTLHASTTPIPTPVPMAGNGSRLSTENWSGSSGSVSQGTAGTPVTRVESGSHQLMTAFNGLSLGKQVGEKTEVK